MATKKTKTEETLDFVEVQQGTFDAYLLGRSPLIMNSMSNKVLYELLLPRGRKSTAERAMTLKHDPVREYRDAFYYAREENGQTRVCLPAVVFKKAIMGAAVDIPGARKAQLGRLLHVEGDEVPIFGLPQLFMSVTRSADMKRTPDVRTRPLFPSWCAKISVTYVEPLLTAAVVTKLLAAAGMIQGVGDYRVEKGSGNYGQFEMVSPSHPQVKHLMKNEGREAQIDAIANPVLYDTETESLMSYFRSEIQRRGLESQLAEH